VLQPITYYPPNANLPATTIFSDGCPGNDAGDEGCTFATGRDLWFWRAATSVLPINPDTRQGRDVTYEVPGCRGHSGGMLLNNDNNAFGILVSGCTSTCGDTFDINGVPATANGVTRTTSLKLSTSVGPMVRI